MRFFLGTHKPNWLADSRFTEVPLFVSRRRLSMIRKLPRATSSWALDSGGFTELQMFGRWELGAREYAAEVRRFADEIGNMLWAAPQDWMCEPVVISGGGSFRGTGLSVREHQRRTVQNLVELRSIAPDLPFVPVLQGWTLADYWRCEDAYRRAGVPLDQEPIVGVGTMCRRQSTISAARILSTLAGTGIRLHGFGFKLQGLTSARGSLTSADSMAWSYHARRRPPMEGHDRPGGDRLKGHKNCANCADYALEWYGRVRELLDQPHRRFL